MRPAATLVLLALAASGPSVSENVEHYDIRGTTAAALRDEMDRRGPLDERGRRFDAFTKWYVSWKYDYAPRLDRCEITTVTTAVEITITLPRWTERGSTTGPLAEQWDRYMRALEAHEKGHSAIGIAAARAIHGELSRFEPRPTCQLLEDDIAARAEGLLDEHREEEATYDRRTRHGKAEGAVFP